MKTFKDFLSEEDIKVSYHNNSPYHKHKYWKTYTTDKDNHELSEKLGKGVEERVGADIHDLESYYGEYGSRHINEDLIKHSLNKKSKGVSEQSKRASEAIIKHSRPLGHEVHLYSGTKTNFGALAKKSQDGILHSPAHISTTHDTDKALHYASESAGFKRALHVLHIHAKPGDKGLHISRLSNAYFPEHHETIIPAGTKLKYHRTDKEPHGYHNELHIHHFTIHDQSDLKANHSESK